VATTAMTHAYTAELGIPYTLVERRPAVMLAGLLFGVLVGLVGGAVPAWATTRTAPAEALRGDGGSLRPPGRWSRMLESVRRLPLAVRLSLRELGRSRRRTLATMLGNVLALVLVLASAGMATSMKSALRVQYDTVQREDAMVTAGPRAPDQREALRGLDGVSAVEPVTTTHVTATATVGTSAAAETGSADGARSYSTSLTGYQPKTTMHGFRTPEGGQRQLPADGGVLAGKALAARLGVALGDSITLRTPDGGGKEVRLSGLIDEPMGSALYGTRSTVETATGAPANGYALRFSSGSSVQTHDRIRKEATALDGIVAYADTAALERQIDRYMALFWVFVWAMLLLGGVLALTVIYVTMTVNIAERAHELATLRAAGVPLRRLAGLLAVENLTATVLALPIGLAAGFGAAWQFLDSFNSDLFSIGLEIGWPVALGAVLTVTSASLLSQIPAVRAIQRLDVARVVRERAG
jgi:putative ABC transport system permease protein